MKIVSKTSNPLGQETVTRTDVPEVVLPFVKTAVNSVNGKTYMTVNHKDYANAIARKFAPTNSRQIDPLKYTWEVEE